MSTSIVDRVRIDNLEASVRQSTDVAAQIAVILARLDKIEGRAKPGPKPKGAQ